MEILYFKELGDTESLVMNAVWVFICYECSLGVYLVIDNFVFIPFNVLPLYYILKQSYNWFIEILHFKDLGDTEMVVTNAVSVLIQPLTFLM